MCGGKIMCPIDVVSLYQQQCKCKDFRLLIVISPNDPQPPIKTLKSWAWWLNIHVHGSISLDSIPSCEIDSMAPFLYAFCLEFKSAHIRGHQK